MIKLKNIQERYNTEAKFLYVLQQINLDIDEGEFVTIVGPSTADKFKLLNILGMLDHDWEGEYYFNEHVIHELKPKQCVALNRQYVGFVFQAFNQLSGGRQQLVAFARAVVTGPMLILVDEPTGNLHSSQGMEIMKLFQKLNKEGTTIIHVTHNDKYAAYGRRIIMLKDGWMEGEVAAEQLLRKAG